MYSNAVKQGEMDDDMVMVIAKLAVLNKNAICNVLFFIHIPIIHAASDELVEKSNVEARLNVLLHDHISASFLIILSANCFDSNLHATIANLRSTTRPAQRRACAERNCHARQKL
jgi:hypothetical protein